MTTSLPQYLSSPRKGFTLLEMMIVLTIIAMVSGALVPVVTRPYVAEYQVEALNEMVAIQKAIAGKPDEGFHGFISDIGALGRGVNPLNVLQSSVTPSKPGLNALLEAGSIELATSRGDQTTDRAPGLVIGWAGPYLRPKYPHPLIDPWGNPYVLELKQGDDSLWRLRSFGPDRTSSTSDDLVLPSSTDDDSYFASRGSVVFELMRSSKLGTWPVEQTQMDDYSVELSPANATPAIECTRIGTTNRIQCTDVWFGAHQLNVYVTGNTEPIFQQKVVLASPGTFVSVLMPAQNHPVSPINDRVDPCAETNVSLASPSHTWPSGLRTVLTGEHTFCASRTNLQKFDHVRIELLGEVVPSDGDTECILSLRARYGTTHTAVPVVSGPLKMKGAAAIAVPFVLSGSLVVPDNADVTVYAAVTASGLGTCDAAKPSSPAGASSGGIVVLRHP